RADGLLAPHLDDDVFENDCRERFQRLTPTRMYDAYASRMAAVLAAPVKTILPRSIIAARVAPRRPCSRSCVVRMIVLPAADASSSIWFRISTAFASSPVYGSSRRISDGSW